MKKRLLSLALALLMIFSLLPVTAFADNLQTITSVSVGGYNPPVIGEEHYDYISYSADDPFTHFDCGWLCYDEDSQQFVSMEYEAVFTATDTYKFYVELCPKDGYKFSPDALPDISVDDGQVTPITDVTGVEVMSNGNLRFYTPEVQAKIGINFATYLNATDELGYGGPVPVGYCPRIAEPGREGEIFCGWYYDREYTSRFIPGTAIFQDTDLFARWVDEGDEIPVDEVEVELEYYPPANYEAAEYSSGVYVDYNADYEVVDSYWYCYSMNGNTNGYPRRIEDNETLWWTGEYSFCIKVQPKAGFVFDDDVTFSVKNINGEAVPVSNKTCLNSDGTIDIWTETTHAADYVSFYNAWGEAACMILKGTVIGEIAEPGRDGYVFDGWFTDEDCTVPYDPTAAIEEDTTLYPKWLKESGAYDIDSVAVELDYFPAVAGEKAESCGVRWETGKHYTVVPYWCCEDNTYGGTKGILEATEVFYAGNQYRLKIRVIPDYGYIFNKDRIECTVKYNGNDIRIDDSYYEHGELILWTDAVEAVEFVLFHNAWGMAGCEIPKGTVLGEQGEPGREDGILFDGWYTDPARTVPYDPTAPIMVDTTVYPKWIDATTGNPLISYVSVEIAPPRADKVPSYQIVIPDGAHYYNDTDRDVACCVDDIVWYNITDQGLPVPPTAYFERGKAYDVEINLTADSGYVFDQYLIAELNGSETDFDIDGGKLQLNHSFTEPVLSDDEYCGENATWKYYNGTLTISGTGDMYDYESVRDTPWYSILDDIRTVIVEKGVTSVGDYAFYWCENLTCVEMRSGVTSIGKWAFGYCRKLQTVYTPSGLTSIGDNAFYDCRALTDIYIPIHVTSIGREAFWNCEEITSVTIPDSVESIGYRAFGDCSKLTSVNISASVTSIGDAVFASCDRLTSINIDEDNTSYCFENGVLFNKNKTKLVQYLMTNTASSYTVPDGVTGIGARAFENNTSLTTLTIPESVTGISIYAFKGCSGLTDIYYGGIAARWTAATRAVDSEELENVTVHCAPVPPEPLPGGTCGDSIDWIITNGDTLVIAGTGDMYDYDFDNYPPWFSYRNDIVSVVIGNGVESIGSFAFLNLTECEDIFIPASVSSIGESAFCNCTKLKSISIPANVTSIGSGAFAYCIELASIDIEAGNNCYCSDDGILFSSDKTELVAYPPAKADTSYTVPSTVTSIDSDAFYHCGNLKSIVIPASVTSIGYYAFQRCSSLESINIPAGIDTIPYGMFDSCESLTEVTIHAGVKSIGDYAFQYCSSLESISIPNGVESIGENAFCGCYDLESISIPASVNSIGDDAFRYCSSLESISIPNGVESIGPQTFEGCYELVSITIPVSVESIDYKAFYECDSLVEVYYGGTETQWAAIDVNNSYGYNDALLDADIHFVQPGDMTGDGRVNALDLVRLKKFISGDNVELVASGDVTGDGRINAMDLVRLQKYLSGDNVELH